MQWKEWKAILPEQVVLNGIVYSRRFDEDKVADLMFCDYISEDGNHGFSLYAMPVDPVWPIERVAEALKQGALYASVV